MSDNKATRIPMPKWKIYAIIGLVAVMLIGAIVLALHPAQATVTGYATTRTCDFVTVGKLTGVFCTDGWTGQVTGSNNAPLAP